MQQSAAGRSAINLRRHAALFLVTATLLGGCATQVAPSEAGLAPTPASTAPTAAGSPTASSSPCPAALGQLERFSKKLAADLAAMRPLVVATEFDSWATVTAARRVSATLTAYPGLVPALESCHDTSVLAAQVDRLRGNAEATLANAFSSSVIDAPAQRGAAATLFGLLPEVLALSEAGQAIAARLGVRMDVAVVADGDAKPLGSLPPLATPTPPPVRDKLVALPRLSVTIWHASVRYFAISGKNPTELEMSDQTNIPRTASGEKTSHAFAYMEVISDTLRPTYTTNPSAKNCKTLGLTGKMTYRVTIPQWTTPSRVLPQMLKWWRSVNEHVRWHEEQHVRIYEKWIPKLSKRLALRACSAAAAIEEEWTLDVMAEQEAFDASEATWYSNFPYTGPWID